MQQRPSVSAALLFGVVLSAMPVALTQGLFTAAMRQIARRHPHMFGRIIGNASILIDPLDLPVRFVLCLDETPPLLKLVRRDSSPTVDAAIRAPLAALVEVLEGGVDGDALFFSRDLAIEGDTGAIVALRNAIDAEDIRVMEDILSPLGPLAEAALGVCRGVFPLIEGAAARIERMVATVDTMRRAGD